MAYDFFDEYDLNHDTSQKRYNTLAAHVYRDQLKRSLDGHFVEKEMPSWEAGRSVMKGGQIATYQARPYSQLNCKY